MRSHPAKASCHGSRPLNILGEVMQQSEAVAYHQLTCQTATVHLGRHRFGTAATLQREVAQMEQG